MESISIKDSAMSLTSFIFTFVQRVFWAYYEWFFDQLDYLIKNWFDFSLKKPTKFSVNVDPLTRQYLEVIPQPKHFAIPLTVYIEEGSVHKEKTSLITALNNGETINPAQDDQPGKNQDELWLHIKEIVKCKQEYENEDQNNKEDPVLRSVKTKQTSEYREIKKSNKRGSSYLDYLSGTSTKLDDYHKKNQSYLLSKCTNDSNVDNYSFTHPNAHSVFSRRTFVLKNPLPRSFKKKPKPFRPTDLSPIFENLAY